MRNNRGLQRLWMYNSSSKSWFLFIHGCLHLRCGTKNDPENTLLLIPS